MTADQSEEMKEKIEEINEIILSWGTLPKHPATLIDSESFLPKRYPGAYLMKSGNSIKIHTENAGELGISFGDLSDRIGIGLPFLEYLRNRLDGFRMYLETIAQQEHDKQN